VLAVRREESWLQTARSPDGSVDPTAAFRTASVTKTFVAATVLRLVDQGVIELDTPVREYLPAHVAALLPRLERQPDGVTLRHLLQHTAGLADFQADLDVPAADWPDVHIREPRRRYEVIEVLHFVADRMEPTGDVGGKAEYSDAGYALTTEIIAAATGRPWFRAMRELLDYERVGLRDTWVEEREDPPASMPALAPMNMRGVDVWSIHPSSDTLGGGGLVSTAPDLVLFFSELLAGRIVSSRSLAQMQSVMPFKPGREVGLGLFRLDTPLGAAWGHTGVHGAFAFSIPTRSITLAGSICSLDRGYEISQPATQVVAAVTTALGDYLA
jgi:D-alanyl-D-alanine carboxypeptidase